MGNTLKKMRGVVTDLIRALPYSSLTLIMFSNQVSLVFIIEGDGCVLGRWFHPEYRADKFQVTVSAALHAFSGVRFDFSFRFESSDQPPSQVAEVFSFAPDIAPALFSHSAAFLSPMEAG
jgi:hypothetical protein